MVGLAAVATSLGSYWDHAALHDVESLHKIGAFFGTLIGGITFTGSIAAFLKLSAIKVKFDLPFKRYLNRPLTILNVAGLAGLIAYDSTTLGSAILKCYLDIICSWMEHYKQYWSPHACCHYCFKQLLRMGSLC